MNIDPSLFSTPTLEERTDFIRNFYPAHKRYGTEAIVTLVVALIALAIVAYGLLSIFFYALAVEASGIDAVSEPHVAQTLFPIGLFLGLFALVHLNTNLKERKAFDKSLDVSIKTHRFAKANNFEYTNVIRSPVRSGFVFQSPGLISSTINHLISDPNSDLFEMGKYTYEIKAGKYTAVRSTTFMRITLDRNLPHMVLDTTADDTRYLGIRLSNLGMSFSKDQAMRLEGNFNDYFTLYAPKEYETDALYVFTPDLMARMIEEAGGFNAEIVDNNLYIYSAHDMPLDKPETYQHFFSIYDSVGAKALKQTRNYRDSRSEVSGEVATGGRRLKRYTSAIVGGAVAVVLLLQGLPVVIEFIVHLFTRLT